ncbi:MAG: nuclear transport factor 2 family protein [Ignavibacteriaceae bacterium]
MEQQTMNNGKSYKLQNAIDETDIQRQMEDHVKALCNMDLEGLMSIYSPDIVSFDVEGTYLGTEAKRKAWVNVFSMIEPPLNYEIRDLTITIGSDVAFAYSYNRLSGKMKNGQQIGYWVRYTACFRKINGNWLIVHEQVSVPVDIENGRVLLDFKS